MKILILILAILSSTTILAVEQKVEFDKITSQQLIHITNQCLDTNYSGDICKQLRAYEDRQKAMVQQSIIQLKKNNDLMRQAGNE